MKCQDFKPFCIAEFKWSNFLFGNTQCKQLVRSRLPLKPWLYVIYRTIFLVYTWSVLIWRCAANSNFYTFLTIWGYSIVTVNFTIKFFAVLIYYSWLEDKVDESSESAEESSTCCRNSRKYIFDRCTTSSAPVVLKLSWLLTNVSSSVALMISIIYWSFLYNKDQGPPDHFNVQLHVINSILVLIDIIVIHIPYRLLHFYQPIFFAFSYVIFNVILWATKGTVVYKILNWNRPNKSLVTVFATIIFLIVLHTFLFLITKALDQCKCSRTNTINNKNAQTVTQLVVETTVT